MHGFSVIRAASLTDIGNSNRLHTCVHGMVKWPEAMEIAVFPPRIAHASEDRERSPPVDEKVSLEVPGNLKQRSRLHVTD